MIKRLISLAMLITMTIVLIVVSNCRPKTDEPPKTDETSQPEQPADTLQ